MVAVIGVLGTIGGGVAGVLITQRRSDRREEAAFERERRRELDRWEREDEARTFEHRREAYAECYGAVKVLARTAYNKSYGFIELEDGELPFDWHMEAFATLQRVAIYGTPAVAEAANAAYGKAWSWGQYGKYDDPDDENFFRFQEAYNEAEIELLMRIRDDLAIPGGQLTVIP
jgi:hypothetical protein